VAAFLVAEFAFTLIALALLRSQSLTIDEYAHLPAGLSHWELGKFSLYRENPPLVRSLVAFPAWIGGARMDYAAFGTVRRSEWEVGEGFILANPRRFYAFFIQARLVVTVLSLACAALIFWWGWVAFGEAAAAVSACLWLTDPNVLAHSAVATTDVGTATFGLLAVYSNWRFLKAPSWPRVAPAGVSLGLALASKFSMLALSGALLLVVALGAPAFFASAPRTARRRTIVQFAAIVSLGTILLNALYLFNGTLSPLGGFEFRSAGLTGDGPSRAGRPAIGNRFRGTLAGRLPVPLPMDYVLGLDSQLLDAELGLAHLEGGRLVRGGSWFSPLDTLAKKLPIGTLLLVGCTAIVAACGAGRSGQPGLVLWLPPLALIALLCSQTGLNWPVRYALPALPFIYIATGALVQSLWRMRVGRAAVAVCLLSNIVGLIQVYPHYLSGVLQTPPRLGKIRGAVDHF
jgi:hypothetical protein